MKELFLCGHTGSDNRGCEAIVRSTIGVFNNAGYDKKPLLATFAPGQDINAEIDKIAEFVIYGAYSCKAQRMWFGFLRKVFKANRAGQHIIQRELWRRLSKDSLCLNIGGDTYCYNTPTVSMALNSNNAKKGVTSVLWGCTVETEGLSPEIISDLKRYTYIVARESMTVQALKNVGVDESRIIRCCDPAFTLEKNETVLPEGFIEGNTVGINISSLVCSRETVDAVCYLIERIVNDTDMNVCLVPHVYNSQKVTGDVRIHRRLLKILEKHKERLCAVDADLSCTELKYIISKCRFFVGARTHSIIAAYSSYVPALALGYSMKSVGIATDIFSTDEGYVLSYKDIKDKTDIYNKFAVIMANEEKIREHYRSFMPDYVKTVEDAAKMFLERYLK